MKRIPPMICIPHRIPDCPLCEGSRDTFILDWLAIASLIVLVILAAITVDIFIGF